MVFKTSGNINIYDGGRFNYIHQTEAHNYHLKSYDGFYRIYQSGDSILWIKDNHRLMCVDLRKEKYVSNLNSHFRKLGFNQPVDDLFLDAQQRIWILSGGKLWQSDRSRALDISTNEGQLQDLSSEKDKLYLFYHTGMMVCYDLKTKTKLYSKPAYPIAERNLYQYTSLVVKGKEGFYQLRNGSKGGFFFFNSRTQTWKKMLETSYPLNTLVVNPNGMAYISCSNGIWTINCQTGEKRYLPTLKKVDGSTVDTEISTVFYDRQGGLWLGTINQGLLYHHPSRYLFTNVGRTNFTGRSTKDITVEQFAEDKTNIIYVKSTTGYYKYLPLGDDKLLPVSVQSIPTDALKKLNNTTRATVLTDSRGWKWTCTPDGLKLFLPKQKKESIFYTENGLANNFTHAILEDRHQNIWITTSSGLNRIQIDPKTRKMSFSTFRSDAGTLDGEYADGAAFEASNGHLYFGGINGFSIFDQTRATAKSLPFSPVFTNLFLRGEKVGIGKSYNGKIILERGAPYTKDLELAYNQNFLSFEFSGLNYQNPSQTYYRYQLKGIDRTWRETSSGRENENTGIDGLLRTSYTNLPPGNYKLVVLVSNNNLDWKVPQLILNLTIHAPWWKTTWAYILFTTFFILVVFTVLYTFFQTRQKNLEREHREEILLLRIRNLIDQQKMWQEEQVTEQRNDQDDAEKPADKNIHNQADAAFLARAMEQVEKNLDLPNYSVEQLSRDLYMDRTGLYRKLIGLLDKSPSLFIRNIRLQKASSLLLEGKLSIAEITEKVGFSSSSYLSKCFQEVYGCRPSEYAQKMKKST